MWGVKNQRGNEDCSVSELNVGSAEAKVSRHLLTSCVYWHKFLSDCCRCQCTYCLQAVITSNIIFVIDRLSGCPNYTHRGFLRNNFQVLIKSKSNWRSISSSNKFKSFFLNLLLLNCLLCLFFHMPTACILHWYQGSNGLLEVPILVVWFRVKELKYIWIYYSCFVLHSAFSVWLYISRTSEVMGEFDSKGQVWFVTVKVLVVICNCWDRGTVVFGIREQGELQGKQVLWLSSC